MFKTDKLIKKLIIMFVLSCSVVPYSASANELNKLDIKRSNSSGNALNVTIFTANPYDENVAVTQKTDNKYVILIPNVSGANTSSVDFSTIKDIVSDVNVKSVNDGANGYTKVTLTTTKPVSITTSSKKSTPLTEEQKAYKNLIAQSRGYSIVEKPSTQQKPKVETVNAASPAKTAEKVQTSQNTAAIPANDMQLRPKSVISKFKDMVDGNNTTSKANVETPKTVNTVSQDVSSKTDKNHLKDTTLLDLQKDIIKETKQIQTDKDVRTGENEIASHIPQPETVSYTQEQTTSKGFDNNMLTIFITLLASIFGMGLLVRSIRKSIENSASLKHSFKENLKEKPHSEIVDFSDIATNSNMSWQEKYQNYVSRIEEIKPEAGLIKSIGNGEYEFVNSADSSDNIISKLTGTGSVSNVENPYSKKSNLKPAQKPKLTAYNKPAMNSMPAPKPIRKVKNQGLKSSVEPKLEIVEKKSEASTELDFRNLISKLDRTLNDSPSVERLSNKSSEDIIEQQFKTNLVEENNNKPSIVHSEEEVISKSMRTSPKLKSFAQKVALEKNSRRVSLPKRSSEIIKSKNIESRHVNLENSDLYSSSRKFKDANLSSADLISRRSIGSNFVKQSSFTTQKPVSTNRSAQTEQVQASVNEKRQENTNNYSMASLDDFFNAPSSSEHVSVPMTLSNRVANSLGKMGMEKAPQKKEMASSGSPFGNKVVRSGYNIDSNSGFFILADENGNSSLVGKVNNTVTVLKEFNAPVRYKVQVRKDNDNVYMVRVGAERFLVELNGEKMGVLIEL